MNVFELFTKRSHETANRTAIVGERSGLSQAVTYADLDNQIDHVMQQLLQSSLQPGDIVLLAVPVSLKTYVAMLALLKAGLVVMTIDPAHSPARVAAILRDTPPAALISTRAISILRIVFPELRKIPVQFVVDGPKRAASRLSFTGESEGRCSSVTRSSADSAILSFTSGSTGRPKGVLRTHGFLREQISMLNPITGSENSEIDFVTLPMFVLLNLANGVTNVIPACDMKRPGDADPGIIYEQLVSEQVTRIIAAPATLERLCDYCIEQNLRLPKLKRISTGGGPVSPLLAGKIAIIAPASNFLMVYGSTEAEPIACIGGDDVSTRDRRQMMEGAGLLAGHPVEGCDVRLIRNTSLQEMGHCNASEFESLLVRQDEQGQIGEIVVSGKHVLDGYVNADHNASTKIDVDGKVWHRTGDAGYFDAASRLWLVGRCCAAIKDQHGAVYPFQIEYAVNSVNGVRRSALICHEGARVLVLETDGREFKSACATAARCIANFHIDRIVTIGKIPLDKRHNSKVDYAALNRSLGATSERFRMFAIEWLSNQFRRVRNVIRIAQHALRSNLIAAGVSKSRE